VISFLIGEEFMRFAECEKHLGIIILNVSELEKIVIGTKKATASLEHIKTSLIHLEIMLSNMRNQPSKE
jgi:hypothetical protein